MFSFEAIFQSLSFVVQQFLFPVSFFFLESELFLLLIQSCLPFLFSQHRRFYLLPDALFRSLAMLFSVVVQLIIHSFDSAMLKSCFLFAIFLCSLLIAFIFFILCYLYGILDWKLQQAVPINAQFLLSLVLAGEVVFSVKLISSFH